MDQYRQIGEVVGSLKALMVLEHEISINLRQCCLLSDIFLRAFDTISEEIRYNLRLDERNTKWKALERPMKELHRIFKEAESYIKYCMDIKDWWGKAVILHLNSDCVEIHIHNLLCCFPVVIEAIEAAAEISGLDAEEIQMRRCAIMKKYGEDWNDPKLFMWKFGKQYLVPRDICIRLESVWKEDKWLLLEKIKRKNTKLGEGLIKMLDGPETNTKLLHSSILLRTNDYFVKRHLGSGGSHLKEINWLGESFALRNFYGDVEAHTREISLLLSLTHPNVLQYHCGFYDEEKKEGFLLMDLMSKSLDVFIKENSSQKKRMSFSTPAAVDIMLQIARGVEYLHSRKIFHGELNPSSILLKPRIASSENYFHAKVAGFGLSSVKRNYTYKNSPVDAAIWYAPEVLAEQEHPGGSKCGAKYSEKADVYSFGMICFQLLTGKVPFEDGERPIEGGNICRNLKAGERPLFPHPSPKYLVNLTKKCWQTDPNLRPSFSSISRILRYIKKVLVINPEHGQLHCLPPLVDYCDIETGYIKKKLPTDGICTVSQIPFQMFAYKLMEREKTLGKNWDSMNDHGGITGDLFHKPSDSRSVFSEIIDRKDLGAFLDQRSVISEVAQRKSSVEKLISPRSESKKLKFLENLEKVMPTNGNCTNSTEEKQLKKTSSISPKLTKIPENKTLSGSEIGQSSTTPDKSTTSKPSNPKIPTKDVPLNKKLKDTKASNESVQWLENHVTNIPNTGKLKDQSPVCSSARMMKRTYSSPLISASGVTKSYSSPVSSPIHPLKAACSSSRGPLARTTSTKINILTSQHVQRKAQERDTEIS